MSEARRLDGNQARRLEILSGIADDLVAAAMYVDRILDAAPNGDVEAWWTAALVRYGRCFGKGVAPWGAAEVIGSLPELLQVRHRHFRRLRDTLASHPGGVDHTYAAKAVRDRDGYLRIGCERVPMFSLGRLEAMDFSELLDALQTLVDRRRVEVENDLRIQLSGMTEEEFGQMPPSNAAGKTDHSEAGVVRHAPGDRPN
jgi:hypothetical protein